MLRVQIFLLNPVILGLLACRCKSGPVQIPFFGNVPGVIIFPLDHSHAIHVLGQPGVLPVLDLDHLVFLVVHPLGLVVPSIPADRPPIRVEGLLADSIPVPVKLPLNFGIRIRGYACLTHGIKPGLAEHVLCVQVGLVYPVSLHAAVDDRLSFRVEVRCLQRVPFVVVLSGEILVSGRQRYRFAVHTEVCFLAQCAEAVVFPLNLCVSRCQRHRLPIHAVVAFLRHLARAVVLSLNDGISGLQGHQLPVDPVIFNDGAFHTLLSLFLIISIGGGFDGFPLFVCVDFLNFFRYFKFLVFLVFFRYFFLCCLFLAFFSLSDPFLVFSFILAHCAQVLHQHRPLIRVFLPRRENQLAVCVVVLHAHDAALAVVLGLNNGIPVFPGGHPVPGSEQGLLRHLPGPVVFHPDRVDSVRTLVRVPVCLPVALAGLVLPVPGVPDFLHAAGPRAGVPLRVVPVRADNVFFFIPLIRHPGIPVLDVDRRLPVRVVVVAFHQLRMLIFVHRDTVSVRVDRRLVVFVVVFFPGLQLPVRDRVQDSRVSQLFHDHLFIVFIQVFFHRQLAIFAEFAVHAAVSVRAPPPLVFSCEIVFFNHLSPVILCDLIAADSLVVVPQGPVRVVPHAPLDAVPVAEKGIAVPVRPGDSFALGSVVVQGALHGFLKFPDQCGIAGLRVVVRFPVLVQVGCLCYRCSEIFVFHPGIAVRPRSQFILCIIPAVAGDQPIFSIAGIFGNPVKVHRVSVLVVFPGASSV